MAETTTPRVVRTYLNELERALAGVSAEVSQGLVAGIAEELDGLDAAAAASRIEELGDPAFIAAEAREGMGAAPMETEPVQPVAAGSQRWYVVLTVVLLAFGGLVLPFFGWLVGVAMLWASPVWSRRDKLVATIAPVAAGVVVSGILAIVSSFASQGLLAWHMLALGLVGVPFFAAVLVSISLLRRGWLRAV
ncbi:hypothetical protein [Glaciihabitans sp. UYNi722]|uniref:HAAS signaling domain-containing protein n=1 Tax=Glaciihabitans sp. UYNi722 TaxID=3156344 RepID=UPI0033914608